MDRCIFLPTFFPRFIPLWCRNLPRRPSSLPLLWLFTPFTFASHVCWCKLQNELHPSHDLRANRGRLNHVRDLAPGRGLCLQPLALTTSGPKITLYRPFDRECRNWRIRCVEYRVRMIEAKSSLFRTQILIPDA